MDKPVRVEYGFNYWFRTRAASITVLINWSCNAIMGAVFPYMAQAIGGSVFFIFATLIFFSSIYLYFFVPETKDKTISDVHKFFKQNKVYPNESLDSNDTSSTRNATARRFSSWFIGLQNWLHSVSQEINWTSYHHKLYI